MDEVEDKGRIAGILPMECLSMGTHTKAYQSYGKINTPKIQGYNMVYTPMFCIKILILG